MRSERARSAQVLSQGTSSLPVIRDGLISVPAISSREFVRSQGVVSTRVPSNLFDFDGGSSVAVSGGVTMRLVDGGGRRLRILSDGGVEGDQESSFELVVSLQPAAGSVEEGYVASHGSLAASMGWFVVGLGAIFAGLSCAVQW